MNVRHYRENIATVIADGKGKVLWAERCDSGGWQFPQGGVDTNEDYRQALYRELYEEVGLSHNQVRCVAETSNYLRYTVPKHLRKIPTLSGFLGQRQKWFLLLLLADDDAINLNAFETPEFISWRWVPYWHALHACVPFKRNLYRHALGLLAPSHTRLCQQHV